MSVDALFGYDAALRARFPSLRAGIVQATSLGNGPSPPALLDYMQEVQRLALERLESGPSLGEVPSIRAWRDVFHACGVKPTRYRVAVEALLRRLHKSGNVPAINALVDIGNCVAITHALPVAVFDRAALEGALRVRFAVGDERFVELGADEAASPDSGEVVFVDESGAVAARRWCWRQSAASAASAGTTEALFVVEGHHAEAGHDVAHACEDLVKLLERFQAGSRAYAYTLPGDGP